MPKTVADLLLPPFEKCRKHRTTDPYILDAYARSQTAYFWAQVHKSGDCWEWKGKRYPSGYGRHSKFYAHRVAYELVHGPIPAGMFVCHRCDNPPCCNPAHLFLGTPEDNAKDRERKGRGGAKKREPSFS